MNRKNQVEVFVPFSREIYSKGVWFWWYPKFKLHSLQELSKRCLLCLVENIKQYSFYIRKSDCKEYLFIHSEKNQLRNQLEIIKALQLPFSLIEDLVERRIQINTCIVVGYYKKLFQKMHLYMDYDDLETLIFCQKERSDQQPFWFVGLVIDDDYPYLFDTFYPANNECQPYFRDDEGYLRDIEAEENDDYRIPRCVFDVKYAKKYSLEYCIDETFFKGLR